MGSRQVILGTSSSLIPAVGDLLGLWLDRRLRRSSLAVTASASAREVLQLGGDVPYDMSPPWMSSVLHRISQLAMLPNGWDTYGGRRLDLKGAASFVDVLRLLAHAIQSEPRVSLTAHGGLIATWSTDSKVADVVLEPGLAPMFGFEDGLADFEWDGPLMAADPRVVRWLWQASA